jgi:glycosyltransferase involved in cell wall biosynthesis
MTVDVLVVGPASRDTGGVARYVTEQQRVLPDDVRTRVFDVRTPGGTGPIRFLVALLYSVVDALRFPFRRRPEVVHVHSSHRFSFYRAAYYVLVAEYVWRRPVVLHVHGSAFDEFVASPTAPVSAVQDVVFGAVDRVIALSDYWKGVLEERVPGEKVVVVPNAVDPDQYEPEAGTGPPRIVFVSNLIERKGVAELTAAIERLHDDGAPPFEVEIAGDGPLRDRVQRLADDYENVTYRGYVSEAEKRRLLDAGSVFVLPTHAEGLPIALLEGMAGGNAVVSTAVGSIPEVLDDDFGVVVGVGAAEELAASLDQLLADPERTTEMGRRSRRVVESEYSWNVVSERLAALYRGLAS